MPTLAQGSDEMESKIDWSKAPADATHYQAATQGVFECWLKPGHAVRVSRREPDWREDDYADDLIATSAIKRPWSGEGLPPVGVVCEYTDLHGVKWYGCEIIAHHGEHVWLRTTTAKRDHVKIASAFRFRPIRTPEQIAADEREAAIKEIEDMIAGYSYRHCAEIVHDKGYRKP